MALTRVPELIGQAFAAEAGKARTADVDAEAAATTAADAIDPSPQPEPLESAP